MSSKTMEESQGEVDTTEPATPETHPLKLFDIARSQGRPLYASAPMVRYSKLAFRQTVHYYGADLCWTPMIVAKEFNRSALARDSDFTLSPTSPSTPPIPTILQLAASTPLEFTRASLLAAPHVSGIDLNAGCPQSWACAATLGAALLKDRELVYNIVRDARAALDREGFADRTVSVKIRIMKDLRKTTDLLTTLHLAGASFLTIHARTPSTPSSHAPNLSALPTLTSHSQLPVIYNGSITTLAPGQALASSLGAAGIMPARALLANPALFGGFERCPWEAVERFLGFVVRAPIPYRLVLRHVGEMVGSGGFGVEGGVGVSGALMGKEERRGLMECRDMLELVDWLDGVREVRRGL